MMTVIIFHLLWSLSSYFNYSFITLMCIVYTIVFHGCLLGWHWHLSVLKNGKNHLNPFWKKRIRIRQNVTNLYEGLNWNNHERIKLPHVTLVIHSPTHAHCSFCTTKHHGCIAIIIIINNSYVNCKFGKKANISK